MPPYQSPVRAYRARCAPREGERTFQVVIGETDLRITCAADAPETLPDLAAQKVTELRGLISAWSTLYPAFRHSLTPVPLPPGASPPECVRRMSLAAVRAGVGPFAAVAGTIAQMVLETLRPFSPDLLVENGGDIALISSRDRLVGLLPHPEAGVLLGLKIAGGPDLVGLCASSATIGHSLSFGVGELAVVRARDASLADALATTFCNGLTSPEAVPGLLRRAKKLARAGLGGVFLQCGEAMGLWGDMELEAVA